MNENSNHMISRLKWETAFDNKAYAVELQERLSDWSGFLMQNEMAAVFEKLCPSEQTWRIQSLELDLGTIDFHNLELELSVKLRQQLHEKLTELILYSHQHGRRIEILDGKKSGIELIAHFLQHGLLPWNYQLADGSINQILSTQLQSNCEELIVMLQELGLNAEQIRQRMAWQFTEANMIGIIEGMEPNAGGQIILFAKQLTTVQQKETVVQATSTADFKKSLWLWMLNYLLTDRGTVFNRLQFMKSSILQMAAHYNMQYEQLFELIELAVAKLSSSLQPDFITTLQLLAKDNEKETYTATAGSKDYWQDLSFLFLNKHQNSSFDQDEFLYSLSSTLTQTAIQGITEIPGVTANQLSKAEQEGLLDSLINSLIYRQHTTPAGPGTGDQQEMKVLLNGIMIRYPEKFFAAVKQELLAEPQLVWLHQAVSFNTLLRGIGYLDAARKSMLDNLEHFYRALGSISISGISTGELQFILFKKVLLAWTSGNWRLIAADRIWNELIWEVCTKKPVSRTEFLKRMDDGKLRFPLSHRLSLESLTGQNQLSSRTDKTAAPGIRVPKGLNPPVQEQHSLLKGGISVRNAGIVLINTYLSMLLERLHLVSDQKKFFNEEAQLSAVHYLQYTVTGLDNTEESLLPLNKLLCGLPLSQPVKEGVYISHADKMLIDGLITAVIGHWSSIGKCSVDGFRGNWLVRDGLLTEKGDRWELTVEKRAYDLLIHKSPFSFSVIRYPWMDKPLYVNWSY